MLNKQTLIVFITVMLSISAFDVYAACSSPVGVAGEYGYDVTSSGKYEYCDGTDWVEMASTGGADVTSGLIGYWKLDETSGTAVADSSGSGNNGTMLGGLNGATDSVAGQVDGALNFDSVADRITLGNIHNLPGSPLSISAWIKANALGNRNSILDNLASLQGYRLQMKAAGNLIFLIRDSSNATEFVETSAGAIPAGEWVHVASTFDDGTTGKVYINGVEAASKTDFTLTRATGTADLYIGYERSTNAFFTVPLTMFAYMIVCYLLLRFYCHSLG